MGGLMVKVLDYDRFFAKLLRVVGYKKAPFRLIRKILVPLAKKEGCSLSEAAQKHALSTEDKELSTALKTLRRTLSLVNRKYKRSLKVAVTKKSH